MSDEKPNVGGVLQLSAHEVGTTKVLPNYISVPVVDANEQKNCIRLAVEKSSFEWVVSLYEG